MTLKGCTFEVYDFGDTIPAIDQDPIDEVYGRVSPDKNKCFLIHLAAALLCLPGSKNQANVCAALHLPKVVDSAAKLRWEQCKQALACQRALGEPPTNDPLVVAELRSHVHDVVSIGHDRDHRTLLCFPLEIMNKCNVCLIRVSLACRYSTHVINAVSASDDSIYLVSYQEHLRVIQIPEAKAGLLVRNSPNTSAAPLGWESILSLCPTNVSIDCRSLSRRPHCQLPNLRLPLGVEGALVGRSMLLTDRQLRSFNIKKPRTEQTATALGPDAYDSWSYENSTPELDKPPALSTGAAQSLLQLFRSIPPEDTEFNYETWQEIANATDTYVESVGDLSTAAHAYAAAWRKERNPTTLKPTGLLSFKGRVGEDLYRYSLGVSGRGVLPCGDRLTRGFRQTAYANVNDDPKGTASELWEDVLKGRLFVFTNRPEQFTGNLMESKLAYVTQKDVANPDNVKTRYISDPRSEVNERIDNDRHPKRVIPRRQNVARMILYWKRRYPGVPILICKRDVMGAFKLIPVSIRAWPIWGVVLRPT